MNHKVFTNAIWISVIVIIAGAVGYFALMKKPTSTIQQTPIPTTTQVPVAQQPTPVPPTPSSETTNWKTYRNEKYGFEFKYPLFTKKTESASDTISVLETPPYVQVPWLLSVPFCGSLSCMGADYIAIKKYEEGDIYKLQEGDSGTTAEGEPVCSFEKLTKLAKREDYSIYDQKGILFKANYYDATAGINCELKILNIKNDKYLFVINISDDKLFNAVVSTFKFTK